MAVNGNFWVPLKNLPEILKYTRSHMGKMPVISYKQENVLTKFGSLTSKKIRDFTFWPKIGHISSVLKML